MGDFEKRKAEAKSKKARLEQLEAAGQHVYREWNEPDPDDTGGKTPGAAPGK